MKLHSRGKAEPKQIAEFLDNLSAKPAIFLHFCNQSENCNGWTGTGTCIASMLLLEQSGSSTFGDFLVDE